MKNGCSVQKQQICQKKRHKYKTSDFRWFFRYYNCKKNGVNYSEPLGN